MGGKQDFSIWVILNPTNILKICFFTNKTLVKFHLLTVNEWYCWVLKCSRKGASSCAFTQFGNQWPVLQNYYDHHNDNRCDAPNSGVTYDCNWQH
jgi:hypothetical protein